MKTGRTKRVTRAGAGHDFPGVMLCATCVLAIALAAPDTRAAPFLLSENPNGNDDLPTDFADLPVLLDGMQTPFLVDVGTNVVQGQFNCLEFGCQDVQPGARDVFRIEVPVGLEITNTRMSSGGNAELFWIAPTGTTDYIFNGFIAVSNSPFDVTETIGPGIYDVAVLAAAFADWKWEFTAGPAGPGDGVPTPATLPLLVTALAWVGWSRRRSASGSRLPRGEPRRSR